MKPVENQTILITGATDGLGKKVANDLADKGATLILHGRNPEKGESVLREIEEATGNNNLHYYNADFSSLDEVKEMAEKILSDWDQIHVLINNAGIGFGKRQTGRETGKDGYELRFQVNYLAGFLLTNELLPLLRKADEARVINVASGAQTPIGFDDVMLEENYSGNRAYGQSKLAQILFTKELAERENESDLTINALHPATYMDTKMVTEAGITPTNSVEKGADAVEHLATSSELEGISGEYFNVKRVSRANDQFYDEKARKKLWKLSEKLVERDN